MVESNNNFFFSIVVPVYNVEKYLEYSIKSVLNQTISDYELILVDDGSTDSSGIICDSYQKQFPSCIKVFHKANEGLLMTRVYGIERATGKYIISLDSDDALRIDALEVIKKTIQDWNADLVMYCASRNIDFSNKWRSIDLPNNTPINPYQIYLLVCSGNTLNNMVLKCFRREYYPGKKQLLGFSHVNNGEDTLQSLYIFESAKKPIYINDILYFYRDNGGSITNTYQGNYFDSISTVGMVLRDYAKKWDKGDGELVTKVLHRNLISCSRTIKEIIKRCDNKETRKVQFDKVRTSGFFVSSIEMGKVEQLDFVDRLLILICKSKHYFWFNVIKMIVH